MIRFIQIAALVIALGYSGATVASDYKAEYANLKEKVGADKLDAYLADWRMREPENPDAYILSANWALESASAVNIVGKDGKPLPKGDYNLELRDGKIVVIDPDGKPVGEVRDDAPSAQGTRKAAAFLVDALKKWPHRADLHCGLATIYADGMLWKEHIGALKAFAAAAREHAGELRWCHDDPLEAEESEFVADKLHDFGVDQYKMRNKQADERFRVIADLLVHTCPKSAKGYNDMAVYYGRFKNWKAMQPMLEKAVEIAPEDALVWMNLGDNSQRLRKTDTARKCYKKVLELKPNAELQESATAALDALIQKSP